MAIEHRSGFSKWLRPQLLVLLVILGVTWMLVRGSAAADLSDWHRTLDEAKAASAQSGRPILAYFSADWCPPCRAFKSETLSASGVMNAITDGYEPAYLDVTNDGSAGVPDAQRHGVRSIPTLMVIAPNGTVVERVAGFMPPKDFRRWIDRHSGG